MIRRTPDLDDLEQEIREHIDAETQDNMVRGMSEQDARDAAVRKFGNVARVKEDVREVWFPRWLDSLRQDARDAVRYVRRNPSFSLAIVVTLALGIGLTTAIYSVVNAVLLRPLAYAHPDRMVALVTREGADSPEIMNSIDFANWQSRATTFEHMVAYGYNDSTMVAGAEASRVRVLSASDGFWQVTGAAPFLGALPTSAETDLIVLTHRVFRDQFNSDPQVVGRVVTLDGQAVTVGGVLPAGFKPQLVPFSWNPALEQVEIGAYRIWKLEPPPRVFTPQTQVRVFQAFGEMKAGVTVEQARTEIGGIHALEQKEHPTPFGKSNAVVMLLQDRIVGPSRLALRVLLAASFVVLLITCSNVANLLLSRSAERRKEIALRMAVGSGPLRVVRQLLAESLGYALLGGVGGVLLASWLVNTVIALIGAGVPRLSEAHLDLNVMATAAAIALGTAVVFGVGPAVALMSTKVQEVLKEGGRSVSASRRVLVTGRVMVAMQVALTIVLLTGAGLVFKSVWQMTTYPPGFRPDQILTMRIDFRGPHYRAQEARHAFAQALLDKARTLPGVQDAALTTGNDSTSMIVKKEGQPLPENRADHAAPVSSISAGFGPLLGMSIVRGRWFNEAEPPGAIVVNESLAHREFPGGDAIGGRLRMPYGREERYGTIIGIASDLKYSAIDMDAKPEIFFHHADTPLYGIAVMMRIDGDPMAAAPAIRKALSSLDPTQSFYSIRTIEDALSDSIAPRRFNLLLLGTFALVALVLAVLGVYGVVAYAVAERTQEIGIRLALGAERTRVVRMIVTHGMISVTAGIAIGVSASLAATRFIASLLYQVDAHDTATFVATALALTGMGFLACAVPALKAAFVDPVVALRAE